jgi:XTP/dITP diphosphohydrolase
MKIVVSTNNKNKIKEIKKVFAKKQVFEVLSYRDIFKEKIEVVEDGQTFSENAVKKVSVFELHKKHIYLADDSGLEVESLNGAPGIYSARYAGKDATGSQLCKKLLADMSNKTNRKANFICVIALKFLDGTIKTVEGKVFGRIIKEQRGDQGFGYDPVFVPDGYDKTFAQMPLLEKNKISHRARALQKALEEIEYYLRVGV